MYDELTKVDIDKMKEELEYRITVVRPEILEEVKFARSHGDLSENAEYHAAKEKDKELGTIHHNVQQILYGVPSKRKEQEL